MFIHLDIDCFFVSAERTLNKSLLDIPVAVGGRSSNDIFSSKKIQRTIATNRAAFSSKILSNDTHKSFKEYFIDENGRIRGIDRKSTRLNSSHSRASRMPSSA